MSTNGLEAYNSIRNGNTQVKYMKIVHKYSTWVNVLSYFSSPSDINSHKQLLYVFVCGFVFFTFWMSSSSCSSTSLVMLYCCSSTRAKYSMARMESLSFRVRTMSWNGERPTVQTPLDKQVSSQAADGWWSGLGIQTEIHLQNLL